MCIIVDANSGHRMRADDAAGSLVLRWILKGGGKAVVSNRLLRELNKTAFGETLRVIEQSGRLCRCDEAVCEREYQRLNEEAKLKSDDAHVIALIIASGCELVFTHDKLLHADIKNKTIVGNCKIYQLPSHYKLLGECRCA